MAKKIVIGIILLAVAALIFLKPLSKLRELSVKNKVLVEEIEYLKRVNASLEQQKKKLEEDIDYVEKRAREKIGVVKEGEIIYKMPPAEE